MASIQNQKWIKHVMAFVIFAAVAMVYFYPYTFERKVLGNQTDRIQSVARQQESKVYEEKEGRPILWTNAIFSGMPTTLIRGHAVNTYDYLSTATLSFFKLFSKVTVPYALIFGGFVGMYFLLLVLKLDWKIAIFGAMLYGLSTSHILVLEGGHFNKLQNLILCPPLLASVIIFMSGPLWVGLSLTALFGSIVIRSAHIQIAFYFAFFLALYVAIQLYRSYKEDELKTMLMRTGLLVIAAILSILPNFYEVKAISDYSEHTIRGKSDLKVKDRPAEGLSKDYAFSWSMGKLESFSLLIPNYMGGTSGKAFVSDNQSHSYKALRGNPNANQLAQLSRQYWGDQPFVGGAYYYGAVLIFLFILSLLIVPAHWRYWAIGAMLLTFMIGWGRNLSWFNFFLFDNFPFFNKFRAVNMMFNLGHIPLVMLGMYGLQKVVSSKSITNNKLYLGFGIAAGIAFLGLLFSYMMPLEGPIDSRLADQGNFLDALRKDRAAILRADAYRAILYIALAAGIVWMKINNKIKSGLTITLVAVLALIDIVSVNTRYVYPDKFVKKQNFDALFVPRPVDKQILKDKDIHYRVFDFANGDPFNSNLSSYHHRLIGGYHPAKIRRYQDVIERYLSAPDRYPHVMNMLNAKYIIQYGSGQGPVAIENPDAMGNAWFPEKVLKTRSGNEEINRLAEIDPLKHVLINLEYSKDLPEDFGPSNRCSIKLENYVPDHLTYGYTSDKERVVTFSEIFYPEKKGWKIFIDGEPYKGIMKSNYLLISALVPEGQHILELKFMPDNFMMMVWLSRIGSILILGLVIFSIYINRSKLTSYFTGNKTVNKTK
jgi:hypothetical protein